MNIEDFTVREETIDTQPYIYARRIGAYGYENRALMERLKSWAAENGLMNDETVILGIARDDPSGTPPDLYRYDVCMPGEYNTHENWIKKGIFEESGSYVVIEMPHTTEVIQLVWKEAFSYLISKGYTLDKNRPVIERYRKALVDKHRCEMLFPVKS